MDEKLDGYFAIRIEKTIENSIRDLPRETKRKLADQVRKLLKKSIQEK